jgi:imidazoleglycerol phosphate synthase glutamine amidotransferase subunit HisH
VETEHEDILTTTVHGESFVSGFQKANITGFQFHPEKSHRYGINLLKSFVAELQPC